MKESLFNALNIEKNERETVVILFIQSMFLGIYYGAYDICAHTLFLVAYGGVMISKAYIISGLVGILLTSIYTYLQKFLSFSKLIISTTFIIALFTIILRLAFYIHGPYQDWLAFAVFIMLGPLNILALVAFWGITGRLFTLRQGKRLYGVIGSGHIFGIILISYAIPLLPRSFKTEDLLYISFFTLIAVFVIKIYISQKFRLDEIISRISQGRQDSVFGPGVKEKRASILILFRNKYVLTMSVFVLFSMLVTFFVAYNFLTATNDKYSSEGSLKEFLGYFTGTVMIFSFLVKTFVHSKLIKTYGLKITLLILPLVLIILTLLVIFSGVFLAYDSKGTSLVSVLLSPPQFIFFFLWTSLSRLFSLSLRDSIEMPSFKTLYQILDPKTRYDIQAKIDGTVNEFSALTSGILLLLFGQIVNNQIIYFSFFLLLLIIIWMYVTYKLHKEYKLSLQESIGNTTLKKTELFPDFFSLIRRIKSNFISYSEAQIYCALKLFKVLEPLAFRDLLKQGLHSSKSSIKDYALKIVGQINILETTSELKIIVEEDEDEDLKIRTNQVLEKLEISVQKNLSYQEINNLIRSSEIGEKILTARIIAIRKKPEYAPYLVMLMHDFSHDVVNSAIIASSEVKYNDLLPFLLEYLSSQRHFTYVIPTLVKFGPNCLNLLDSSFNRTDIEITEQKRIIKTLGEIGTDKGYEILFSKIHIYNRVIIVEILKALRKINYAPDEQSRWHLNQLIKSNVGIAAYDINILYHCKKYKFDNELITALEKDLESVYKVIFLILSITYDEKVIQRVMENLEINDNESISYAIELLDLFIVEELKGQLFPLFENLSSLEKIRKLEEYFPLEDFDRVSTLLSLINREYNYISTWTKTCAMLQLPEIENYKITDDIVAHLFNPDELLRETAAYIIYGSDKESYGHLLSKLKEEEAFTLNETIIQSKAQPETLIFNKIKNIMTLDIFKNLPSDEITSIATKLNVKDYEDDCNIYDFQKNNKFDLYLLIKGKAILFKSDEAIAEFSGPVMLLDEFLSVDENDPLKLKASDKTLIYSLLRSDFFELVHDYDILFEGLARNLKLIN